MRSNMGRNVSCNMDNVVLGLCMEQCCMGRNMRGNVSSNMEKAGDSLV